jgi:[acyl-carrier-protein] S-malonyltransferase
MGKSLYDQHQTVRDLFSRASEILKLDMAKTLFEGSEEDLKQTQVTQPAIFLHSVAAFYTLPDPAPAMVAGHSLGEFSALVANQCLLFEDALKLVALRASAMQKACEAQPSTMAAILALDDARVDDICREVQDETGEIVVAANYNCPGQLVISGTLRGIEIACERMKAAGAKRALVLPVGGAFHSPLMEPARMELSEAIQQTRFETPVCPVYQNIHAESVTEPQRIRENLVAQLTGPVRWTKSIENMVADGAEQFTECGPGKVLQGLIGKIHKGIPVSGIS